MKKYVYFYLDESGSSNSEFFSIGGFYVIKNDIKDIQKLENSIKSNVYRIEHSIKKYRWNYEKELNQYIVLKGSKNDKEVKWNTLTLNNKFYLFNNIKNFNQKNISISCNLNKWSKRPINLDAIFNMMTYYLIERILNKSNVDANDEIIIKVYIDQRKTVPKIINKKLESLEGYIQTRLYNDSKFNILKTNVIQLNSKHSPLIRYSDFYVGLINSMCRLLSNKNKHSWDVGINTLFELVHSKFNCICFNTIKNQCEVITKLCGICNYKNN